jgi:tetraacyldisaccharide 4'-kinase
MPINLTAHWYLPSKSFLSILLLPFTVLFWLSITVRRWLYQWGIVKVKKFHVPIIVVGNLTVGGTGKTPFVIWLAQFLKSQGYHPGIVSRGVGGKKHVHPHIVQVTSSDVKRVGDEALLLAKHTECPVVLCVDRALAVQSLLTHFSCDIVLSDDGLQHYRLGRDLEIALIDGLRGFGNKQLLPAGPLREPVSRLKTVDFIIVNEKVNDENLTHVENEFVMTLKPSQFISIKNPQLKIDYEKFPYKKIHAVAAIGHPERFFLSLEKFGFEIIRHIFPDHYLFQRKDLEFQQTYPIIMTEKDAVKCYDFADERFWYVHANVELSAGFEERLCHFLRINYAN